MRGIGLSSDTPNAWTVRTAAEIARIGEQPILITWTRNQELVASLGGQWAKRVVFVDDLQDPLTATAAIASAGAEFTNWISIPDTLTDTFLYATAALKMRFPFLEAYARCRLKPLAREIARDKKLSLAEFAVIDRHEPGEPGLPYPFVCKPLTGTGSRRVAPISDRASYDLYRAQMPAPQIDYELRGYRPQRQLLAEQQLRGVEIELDGFAHAGVVHVCGLGFKHHDFRREGFREVCGLTYRPFAFPGREKFDGDAIAWAVALLRAIDFEAGCFHIEAMHDGSSFELIEINPRPGGGGVQPIVEALSGVSLATECVRLWLGLPPERLPQQTETASVFYSVVYPDRSGRLEFIRPEGPLDVPWDGASLPARWVPIASVGRELHPDESEQYLGEAHVANVFVDPPSLTLAAHDIDASLRDSGAWRISE